MQKSRLFTNDANRSGLKILILTTAIVFSSLISSGQDCRADDEELMSKAVISVAHRGGIVPGTPENTLAAYQKSIELGVHAIEIDLRGTKDGAVVIMHDETVDRTTNGNGRVVDQTLEEIRQLDAGHGEKVPTYEEVLQYVAGTGVTLLLDIKESPVLDKLEVVRLTQEHNSELNVIVGVRNLEDYHAFREINPNLRILGFMPGVEAIEPFVNEGIDIIRLWPAWIMENPHLIQKVHQLGKPVWTTAGDAKRDELEELIKLGVDGILSDSPVLMDSILTNSAVTSGQ
jgi:glycerophosphoryl diester phosphodiesterase